MPLGLDGPVDPPRPSPRRPPSRAMTMPSATPSGARALVLFRMYAALAFSFAWVPVMYTAFTLERGFSPSQYAEFWGAYYIAMVLTEVPWGRVADRWGQRRLLVLGPLWLAGCFLVLSRASDAGTMLLAMAATGAGHAMISGADSAYLYELLLENGRGDDALLQESRAHRWRLFGVSIADLGGGIIAATLGTTAAFDASVLIMLLAAGCAYALPALRRPAAAAQPSLAGVVTALRMPGVTWVLAWYAVVFVLLRMGFQLYQPTLISEEVHDLVRHGGMFALLNLIAGLSAFMVTPVFRRLGERGTATLVLLLIFLSFAGVVPLVGRALGLGLLGVQLALFALQQTSFGFLQPVGRTALNQRIPSSNRTSVLSAQSMLGRLAVAIVLLGGRWDDAFESGLDTTYTALAGVALVGALLLFVTHRGTRLKRP